MKKRRSIQSPLKTRLIGLGVVVFMLSGFPVPALANVSEEASAVALYTAVSLGVVLVMSALLAVTLSLVVKLGVIGVQRQLLLRERLRVGFGATFLLAAVSPYVALNFSMTYLLPFVVGAGLIVSAWVWAATKVELPDFDSDIETV